MSTPERESLEAAKAELAKLKVWMWTIAGTNLFLGALAESGATLLRSLFGFGAVSLVIWGLCYAWLIVILRHPRTPIFLGTAAILDCVTMVWNAQDAGSAIPWLGLLLRPLYVWVGWRGHSVALAAAAERYWAEKKPLISAIPPRVQPRSAPPPVKPAVPATSGAPVPPPLATPRSAADQRTDALRAAMPPAAITIPGTTSTRRGVSGEISIDRIAEMIAFVARRVVVQRDVLQVTGVEGTTAEHACGQIAGLWIRRLPTQKPWAGEIVLDILPAAAGRPIRLFATTAVQFAEEPRAAGTRLETYRRLAQLVTSASPQLTLDAETQTFLSGGPPLELRTFDHFVDYNRRYS